MSVQNTYRLLKCSALKTATFLALMLVMATNSFGQAANGTSPCDARPFCSDSSYTFPNTYNAGSSVGGPSYGCLATQPNAIWYYMQIGVAGTIQLTVSQSSGDLDFAMWGPFTDLATGCAQVMAGVPPIQCSYSTASTETIGIGVPGGSNQIGQGASTPPPAQVGEVYIVVLTNYANTPGTISFSQTAGTGSADCSILYCDLETFNSGATCAGQPFQVMATNDTAQFFSWTGPFGLSANTDTATFVINTPGNYTFTVTSYIGTDTCVGTTTVTILPSVYDTTTAEICQGTTYNFLGDLLYESGQYSKVFANQQGCDSIITLNLTVNPLPNVETSSYRRVEICEGDQATFGLLQSEQGVSYQWYRNNALIAGETGDQITTNIAGSYYVKAVTQKGCEATSRNFELIIHPNPDAAIIRDSDEILCAYDTITLRTEQNDNYIYEWSPERPFKAITGTQTAIVKGVFPKSETLVELTIVNEHGCRDSDAVIVRTQACCEVFIPNAFSPNDDQVNDYFQPVLEPTQLLIDMKIFDRYGQMVYNNNTPKQGWDGRYPNGELAKTDAYMYLIQYTCSDGKVYQRKGSVVLAR